MTARWLLLLSGPWLGACDGARPWPAPDPGLARMIEQGRADSYEPSRWFADGKILRSPPAGTLPYEAGDARTDIVRAVGGVPTRLADRPYEPTVPIAVDRELLKLGAERYRVFCAVCHGASGDGQTPVAAAMSVRKPPSLREERLLAYPPGRIFAVVTQGYGLMPSYALEIDARGRWAVVAHVMQRVQGRSDATTSQLEGARP